MPIYWCVIRLHCGLPPIELYKPEECTQAYSAEQEKELSTKEILFGHVFNNKLLWIIAFANAFIYFVRYGVLDWAPMYLEQVKHMVWRIAVGRILRSK